MAQSWVGRRAVQKELRIAVVVRRAQRAIPCADRSTGRKAHFRLVGYAIGGRLPFIMPAVVIADLDAARGRHRLAELGAAIVGGADDTEGLEPELRIFLEQ